MGAILMAVVATDALLRAVWTAPEDATWHRRSRPIRGFQDAPYSKDAVAARARGEAVRQDSVRQEAAERGRPCPEIGVVFVEFRATVFGASPVREVAAVDRLLVTKRILQ